MKSYEYPLVCWQIGEGAVLGQLVGVDKQLVGDDVKSIKASFIDYLNREMKKGNYWTPELTSPKIKVIPVKVRPSYQEEGKIFPVKETVVVELSVLYGKNGAGYYECLILPLKRWIHFYQLRDLDKLVEHFTRDILSSMNPKEIYSLLLPQTPWLESLSVKFQKPKTKSSSSEFDFANYPTLAAVAERLPHSRKNNQAGKPDMAWERGHIVDQIKNILLEEQSPVLLVGKSGVGKSAIIQDVIKKINTQEKAQKKSERHSFWRTNPSRMTAKAKYLGEWQLICEEMIEELRYSNGIVWMENFVSMALTGGDGPEDSVAAFLLPSIRKRDLSIISEVSLEELDVMRRLLPGLVEHFRLISIEEMSRSMTLRVFEYYNLYIQKQLAISFDKKALELCFVLLDRFIRYESFPGKAIRFLQGCTSYARLNQQTVIDTETIITQFSAQTGMSPFFLRDDVLIDGQELEEFFTQRIKGQDHVIKRICSIIKVFKTGLNDPNKPISTLLFAGPTGVGKTATARVLAEYFFGKGQEYQPLIRLDMSEFQHPAQIHRLIGSDGSLVQHVREHPFCVVLLDEIEKAHPLIFDSLLTVMDEGILMDDTGRLTDFRSSIIIMTSNLGGMKKSSLGFKDYQPHDYEGDIKAFFRPEFYNRIDMCLTFDPLEEAAIHQITRTELAAIPKREGIQQRKLQFSFTEDLISFLAIAGFHIKYGARPLQREIERLLVAPLGRLLVENMKLNNKKIQVDYDGERVVFYY